MKHMKIMLKHIRQLFNEDTTIKQLLTIAPSINLPQRLTWLYVIGNTRESELEELWYHAVEHLDSSHEPDIDLFDTLYRQSESYLIDSGLSIDRQTLATHIVNLTKLLAQKVSLESLALDPKCPHFLRQNILSQYLPNSLTIQQVCQALDITVIHSTQQIATLQIESISLTVECGDDNFSDLDFDENGIRTAAIMLATEDLHDLSPYQAIELSHEIGHCRHHLTTVLPSGDYDIDFWDSELPAFNEEFRFMQTMSTEITEDVWIVEAIKQSVFTLFSLLAADIGVKRAFLRATEDNPIYAHTEKKLDWLLQKEALFHWAGVPYVQYFLSLVHFYLQNHPDDTIVREKWNQCLSTFTSH
ncbi:hypothetical protein RND59_19045 [Vibrio ruber]|uniref:hypothetical protein n=1 Tax=Vibrio ruber TaxID=184755 RepID=UPI0028934675|nr:hypothetical protein [Vibrio ruber]WNJ97302.1 hypothetical protein RND59_19045 [Vibrio ruber]